MDDFALDLKKEFLYLLLRGVVELLADGRASAVRNSQRGAGCCQRRRVPHGYFRKNGGASDLSASVRVYDAVSGQHYQWKAFDGSNWHRNAVPACVDRIFLGTGADDVEKRTAALCSGRRLTDGEENWYF